MKSEAIPNPEVLKQVQEAFTEYLRERGGKRRHWPERLRRLAARAVDEGCSPGAVARAVGVSRGSIVNWRATVEGGAREIAPVSMPSAVELRVVQSRNAGAPPSDARVMSARILFLSGAILECPVSAVNAEMIAALNGCGR